MQLSRDYVSSLKCLSNTVPGTQYIVGLQHRVNEQMNWQCPNLISNFFSSFFLFTSFLPLLTLTILNPVQFLEYSGLLIRTGVCPYTPPMCFHYNLFDMAFWIQYGAYFVKSLMSHSSLCLKFKVLCTHCCTTDLNIFSRIKQKSLLNRSIVERTWIWRQTDLSSNLSSFTT